MTRFQYTKFLLAVLVLTRGVGLAQSPANDLKALYDAHSCFQMRERVLAEDTPLFYRAVAACNFREAASCGKGLKKVQHQNSSSNEVWEATSLLAQTALAEGRYREAYSQVKILRRLRPDDKDAENAEAFFSALATYGDQKLVLRQEGKVEVKQFDGNIGAELTINGHSAAFLFDTGSNVSLISKGQARLLGLAVHQVNAKMNVATGAKISFLVADAKRLRLGNVEIENVAFLVLPDEAEPFVDMPQGERGILGLPVLLAAQTLRMHDGTFDIGFKPAKYKRASANMCAYGPTLQVELVHNSKPLTFALDTGAVHTDLYTQFANVFPALMASGTKESYVQNGIGNSKAFPTIVIRSVNFSLAGYPLVLSPARILMKPSVEGNSETLYGNLGMDLLGQGKELTFDFRAMQLTLH